jgi:hypothetical protein
MCAHRRPLGRSGREQAALNRMIALEELELEAEGSSRGAEVTTASYALVQNGLQNHLCPRLINPHNDFVPFLLLSQVFELSIGFALSFLLWFSLFYCPSFLRSRVLTFTPIFSCLSYLHSFLLLFSLTL